MKNEFYEEIKQCINDIPVNTFVKSAIREKLDRGSCKENVCVCYAVYENTSGEKVPVAFCKEREIAETMAALSIKYSVEVIEPSVISVSIL